MNSACSAQLLSEVEFSKCSRSGNTKHGDCRHGKGWWKVDKRPRACDVNPASGMVQKYKKESEFTEGKLKMGRATGRLTISAKKGDGHHR